MGYWGTSFLTSEHVMNINFPLIQVRDIHELLSTESNIISKQQVAPRFLIVAGLNLI